MEIVYAIAVLLICLYLLPNVDCYNLHWVYTTHLFTLDADQGTMPFSYVLIWRMSSKMADLYTWQEERNYLLFDCFNAHMPLHVVVNWVAWIMPLLGVTMKFLAKWSIIADRTRNFERKSQHPQPLCTKITYSVHIKLCHFSIVQSQTSLILIKFKCINSIYNINFVQLNLHEIWLDGASIFVKARSGADKFYLYRTKMNYNFRQ